MKDNTGPAWKFAVPSICRRYHSGFVSFSKTDSVEFLCAVSEVAADDDDVSPRVAKPVGYHVGAEYAPPSPDAQSRKDQVILGGLAAHLVEQCCFVGVFTGLGGFGLLYRVQVVKSHAPFEGGSQQHRAQRLEQIGSVSTPGRG